MDPFEWNVMNDLLGFVPEDKWLSLASTYRLKPKRFQQSLLNLARIHDVAYDTDFERQIKNVFRKKVVTQTTQSFL